MIYGCCRVSTKHQLEDGNSVEDQQAQILEKYPNAEIVIEAYTGGELQILLANKSVFLKAPPHD